MSQRRNTAENDTWGECLGELVLCDEQGRVGYPYVGWFVCTGGQHVAPGQFYRCISSFHDQEGPMAPGIGGVR